MARAPQESSRRRAGIRLGVAVQILLACVLLGAVNYAGFRYYVRGDWSPAQRYRLSEQTTGVLGQLATPVNFYVFFSPTTAAPGYEVYGDVLGLLKEYQFAAGDKLTVEYIDPMRNLARARELQARFEFGPEENLVVVESGGRTKQISATEMAEYDLIPQLSGDPPRVVAFKGEQVLTSALIELGESTPRTVYLLQGQGEPPAGENSSLSLLLEYITRQGVRVAPLNLGVTGGVPADAGAVLIAGSRYDLPPASAAILSAYWERDGRLLVFLDPAAETPLLREFISAAGISPRNDRVLRTVELGFATGIVRDVSGQFSPVSRVTRRLQGAEAMLPGATCSLVLDQSGRDTTVEPLISAEEPFWGETAYVTDESQGVAFDAGGNDTPAPLVVAALAERGGVADEKVDVSSARLVVVGNSEFAADGIITEPNLDFVLNALNWLLDRGYLAGITPKTVRAFTLNLTDLETGRLALYIMVVIPAVAAMAGLAVWWRRRR